MQLIEVTSLDAQGLEVFSCLTEAQLRNRLEPDKGIFIAERPKVIKGALKAGYQPLSFLCEARHVDGKSLPCAQTAYPYIQARAICWQRLLAIR